MTRPSIFNTGLIVALLASSPVWAEATIELPDPGFAPEGIAVDASGGLYIGSLTEGRILHVSADGASFSDFAPEGKNGLVSVIGVHASGNGKTIFACSSDPGASKLTKTAAPALVAFDAASGDPAGRFELPEGGAFCNDVTELPDGTVLATDSFVPRIYSLKPGADHLEIWLDAPQLNADGFNFNGIAYDDGHVYVLRYSSGTMHDVAVAPDGSAGDVTQVALPRALSAPDGLTAIGGGRFLIVEGGGLTSGVRGQLTGATLAGGHGELVTIAPDLNIPTTAAIHSGKAYVVEGQLDHLFDPEAGPADPYRVLVIDLPSEFR